MKRAYSYVRFSTVEQIKGKSLERQTEAANQWCKQHDVKLDTELTLHDLGVSAFRGKNADVGALGSFLRAVHTGQVPKNSYLLIETFDRMSRESAYDAQLTLQNIINAGITVVTLMDGKQYNVSILRTDPLALIYAILLMSRSHEESATKSKRISDAWRRKRNDILTGKKQLITKITPGWIALDRHGKPQLIAARAKVVRRIFTEFNAGTGRAGIARRLNADNVPTFGGGQLWTMAYLRIILKSRATIGEFQAHRYEHHNGKSIRVPDGDPIKNYWPAVIDRETFDKAQRRLEESKEVRSSPGGKLKSIFAGLAQCPVCSYRMDRIVKAGKSRLVCARARFGGECEYHSVDAAAIEKALIANAAKLDEHMPDNTAELRAQIESLEAQREQLRVRIEDMALVLTELPSKTVAARIQQDEAQIEQINLELAQLRSQLQYGNARRVKDAVERMKSALQWHAQDPSDVVGVNAALKECFEKIVVDYPRRQVEMYWRHGQTTRVPY